MSVRQLAVVLGIVLSGTVLVDSWVDPGADSGVPGSGPEIVDQRVKGSRVEGELELPVPLPVLLGEPGIRVDPPPPVLSPDLTPRPGPVDPSGWLGRRHLRSPA